MARIRTIKPEFWTDRRVGECSTNARLLFIATWNFADDHGGLDRSAKQLKAQAFPYDDLDCEPLVKELLEVGLLIEYEVAGDKYLHIKNFRKHQRIDKPQKARIPVYEHSENIPRTLPDSSKTIQRSKGMEGNGMDRKGEESTKVAARPRAVAEPPEFLKLKLAYPRRAGSQPWSRALQAINARLREGHSWDEILDGAHRYADFCSATGKVGTEHVQQAARFCGPGKEFLQPWGLPATKADTRLNANLSAADEFMRRTEPPDDTH
jgi:hypothetical protein